MGDSDGGKVVMEGQRKGGKRESQADSTLIMEPDVGLDVMTLRS